MRSLIVIGMLMCAILTSGCSISMASKRSTYKGDPSVIQVGADRAMVEGTLGAPDMSASLENGRTKALYKIDPGAHTQGAKYAAVGWHTVADILTLGLWEIVGTPLELAAQDQFTTYIINYNKEGRIEQIETFK